jgi:hypothetical protein
MESILVLATFTLVPFIVERFYFKVRHGPFAILLYVFLVQLICLAVGSFVQNEQPSYVAGKIFQDVFIFLAAMSYLTIGIPPVLAALSAFIWILVKLGERFLWRSKDTRSSGDVEKE